MRNRRESFVGGIILIIVGAGLIFPFVLAAVFQNILLILGIYFIYLGICRIQKHLDHN